MTWKITLYELDGLWGYRVAGKNISRQSGNRYKTKWNAKRAALRWIELENRGVWQ
jgi:hypothetical protein